MMGVSLLTERGDLPASHLKTLQRVKASGHRMVRMIADLLDFEHSRAGTIPITPKDVCIRDVITQVVEEIEVGHPSRTLMLTTSSDGRGKWDADRFAQMVSNPVGNALQHSPPDTPVTISLVETADDFLIEVSNVHKDAIGESELQQMFEPFRRSKDSTGLGLGLYIVRQVAIAHGGTVSVRCQSEHTTFSVKLRRNDRQT